MRLDLMVDPEAEAGQQIIARPELDPQEVGEYRVGAIEVTPVGPASPLHIAYGINQTSLAGDDRFVYTLTASNTSSEDLLNVSATMLMPGSMDQFSGPDSFDCGSNNTCSANELVTWNIGTLRAGEFTTVMLRSFTPASPPTGWIMRSRLIAASTGTGQVSTALDIHIDPTPNARLRVSTGPAPVTTQDSLTYTFTIASRGTNSLLNPVLQFPIPEGTSYVDDSNNGVLEEGILTWDLGPTAAGGGHSIDVVLDVDEALSAGQLLIAYPELHLGEQSTSDIEAIEVTPSPRRCRCT